MLLDMKTIFLSIAIGHIITAVLVSAYWFQHLKNQTAKILFWAKLAQASAWLFLAVHGGTSDFATLSISNSLLFLGATLEAATILSLQNWLNRAAKTALTAIFTVDMLGFHALLLLHNTETVRIAFSSIGTAAIIAIIAIPMIITRRLSFLARMMGWFYGFVLLFFFARAFAAMFTEATTSFFEEGSSQSFSLMVLYLIMLATNMGSFLLMKERADKDLIRLANYDEMTGTLNRRAFVTIANQQIADAAQKSKPLSLLLFDVDQFKLINDSYGHDAGDRFLTQLADILKLHLTKQDVLARFGGDEFAILLPNRNEQESEAFAEHLRRTVETGDMPEVFVNHTISIGVLTVKPDWQTQFDPLYTACDKALYMAKQKGRNRVCRTSIADCDLSRISARL